MITRVASATGPACCRDQLQFPLGDLLAEPAQQAPGVTSAMSTATRVRYAAVAA
jgi:hypothetical protein